MAGGKLISTGVEFPDATTQTTSGLPLTGGALTGAVTTTSTFDGRDVAADGVTADAALPKAGGTMTGTIAGFTSTGIDDNATSTAITISAAEDVGINTTAPTAGYKLHVKGSSGAHAKMKVESTTATGQAELYLTANSAGGSLIHLGDEAAASVGRIAYYHADNDMRFETNGTEKARIQSGGGISFNGDTAAANALDDYETGSFTPSLQFDVGGTGIVYGTRTGTYTKIGNLVHLNYRITVTSGVSASDYFCRLVIPWSIVQGAGDQVTRAKQYNSGLSDWALSSQSTSTAPVFYASNSINDFAQGDDINGRTISGSYTFIAQ